MATPVRFPAKVMAEVYRLHHIPLPRITLQALLSRGPKVTPATVEQIHADPNAIQQWKQKNEALIVKSAQLLHREVPIRLARRIVDLENLPNGLPKSPLIIKLRENLVSTFDELISCPEPHTLMAEQEFMELHRRLRAKHSSMHSNLSDTLRNLTFEPPGLSDLLDSFYNSRIGIRMLVDQHIAAQEPVPGFSGIVADHCSPLEIAHKVVEKVKPMWATNLTKLPEFEIQGTADAKYRYIPQHIELILSEVMKNAVLNSIGVSKTAPPPVQILVSGGAHGVCIKVSDRGGGMSRDQANALFAYVQPSVKKMDRRSAYDPVAAALERRASGMDFQESFGLRIASLYAGYFGGALNLMPMEGHGVDAYIYMNCLTDTTQVK